LTLDKDLVAFSIVLPKKLILNIMYKIILSKSIILCIKWNHTVTYWKVFKNIFTSFKKN